MMIASANPPAHALCEWPQPTTGSPDFTMKAKTKTPITIDGNPFRTSSHSRTWFASGRLPSARARARPSASSRALELEAPHDQLRGDVRDERDHEQDQREVDQRRDLKLRDGALVLVRDAARERVAGREDRHVQVVG